MEVVGERHLVEEVGRDEEAPPARAAFRLDPRCRVHDVPAVDDVAAEVPHLRRHDLPSMRARSELRDEPIAFVVPGGVRFDGPCDEEEEPDGGRATRRPPHRPRHHHLITDVLDDAAAGVEDGPGDVAEEVVLEGGESERSKRLRDGRRVGQVEEKEGPFLSDGLPVPPDEERDEHRWAEHEAELGREVDEEAGEDEEREEGSDRPPAEEGVYLWEFCETWRAAPHPYKAYDGGRGYEYDEDVRHRLQREHQGEGETPCPTREDVRLQPRRRESHEEPDDEGTREGVPEIGAGKVSNPGQADGEERRQGPGEYEAWGEPECTSETQRHQGWAGIDGAHGAGGAPGREDIWMGHRRASGSDQPQTAAATSIQSYENTDDRAPWDRQAVCRLSCGVRRCYRLILSPSPKNL